MEVDGVDGVDGAMGDEFVYIGIMGCLNI